MLERGRELSAEARRALRLLDIDFTFAENTIDVTRNIRERGSASGVDLFGGLETEAWAKEKDTIASLPMAEADWQAIKDAATWIEGLHKLGVGMASGDLPEGLVDDYLAQTQDHIDAARAALARLRPTAAPAVLALMAGQGNAAAPSA